jgi:putative DNA-invertase from lambdoid prophage Rac
MTADAQTRAALWARVSTEEQYNENQLAELRAWAARRGVEVVQEYVTEDSAWATGNGGSKGKEFDRQRRALLEGARLNRYGVVMVWGVDRLSRRGAKDMLGVVERLTDDYGCALWSLNDPWAESASDPMIREMLFSFFATIARFESQRRSERTKAGLARRKAQGLPVGGANHKRGKDKRKRSSEGYVAAWTPERRAALAERNRQRATARQQDGGG